MKIPKTHPHPAPLKGPDPHSGGRPNAKDFLTDFFHWIDQDMLLVSERAQRDVQEGVRLAGAYHLSRGASTSRREPDCV